MSPHPNFFIVGAPKAGTTSLYHYLDQHPQIYMSPVKEPNYFASEVRPDRFGGAFREEAERHVQEVREYLAGPMLEKRFGALGLEWAHYLKLFQNARGEKAIGEASVCYLWSESAAENIFARVPSARIIMILRDPADRAFSQYVHGLRKGVVQESFRAHIEKSLKRADDGRFSPLYPFLEMGLYAGQVKRYLDLFPRENVLVNFYEDYQRDAGGTIARVLGFLGVDASFVPDMSRRYLDSGASGNVRLDPGDRSYLTDYYRRDIHELSALLSRDLSYWLT